MSKRNRAANVRTERRQPTDPQKDSKEQAPNQPEEVAPTEPEDVAPDQPQATATKQPDLVPLPAKFQGYKSVVGALEQSRSHHNQIAQFYVQSLDEAIGAFQVALTTVARLKKELLESKRALQKLGVTERELRKELAAAVLPSSSEPASAADPAPAAEDPNTGSTEQRSA